MEQGIQRIDYRLLQGCCLEAERADIISVSLEGLRMALPEAYGGTITSLVDEIRRSARKLRDLADLSQMHFTRVPILLNYLDVILPCYCKTLRDITEFYEDRTVSKDMRWRRMYHKMTQEAGGLPLPQRFMLYNCFLESTLFDLNGLETLRTRIIKLREARGLRMFIQRQSSSRLTDTYYEATPTTQVGPVLRPEIMLRPTPQDPVRAVAIGKAAWLMSPPSQDITLGRADLLTPAHLPNGFEAHQAIDSLWSFPDVGTTEYSQTGQDAVQKSFSNGPQTMGISLLQNLGGIGPIPLHVRLSQGSDYLDEQNEPKGVQARNQILDDGFKHSLIVYRDLVTQGLRLQASVWDGELKNCPVWTAFVTHQSASPTWLVRKSDHRIWLKDVQLYVFCQQYHQQNQRKGSSAGAFEIDFVSEMGATRFIEEIQSQVDPSEASTDTMEAIEDAR
ncbi:hypothetical protein Landi51_05961 [Colletotrichum acutatum]